MDCKMCLLYDIMNGEKTVKFDQIKSIFPGIENVLQNFANYMTSVIKTLCSKSVYFVAANRY